MPSFSHAIGSETRAFRTSPYGGTRDVASEFGDTRRLLHSGRDVAFSTARLYVAAHSGNGKDSPVLERSSSSALQLERGHESAHQIRRTGQALDRGRPD